VDERKQFRMTGTGLLANGGHSHRRGQSVPVPGLGTTNVVVRFTPTAHGRSPNTVIFGQQTAEDLPNTVSALACRLPTWRRQGRRKVTGLEFSSHFADFNQASSACAVRQFSVHRGRFPATASVNAIDAVHRRASLLINRSLAACAPT